ARCASQRARTSPAHLRNGYRPAHSPQAPAKSPATCASGNKTDGSYAHSGSLIKKRRAWIERQSIVKILVDVFRLAIRGGVENRLNGPVLCRGGSSKVLLRSGDIRTAQLPEAPARI